MRAILICVGGLLLARPMAAQVHRWGVTVEAGEMRFGGTSADTSSDGIGSFRPFRPAMIGLRLERGERIRMGIGLVYGRGPAALIGPDVAVAGRDNPLTLLELAPTVAWRISQVGGGALYLAGGPVVDRWSWSVAPTRWRLGGEVAARLDAPLGASTGLLIRVAVGRSASVLEDADLPATFERRASWRRSIGAGFILRR